MDSKVVKLVLIGLIVFYDLCAAGGNGNQQCGVSRRPVEPFLKQAKPASAGRWPWHAALSQRIPNGVGYYWNQYRCGGTLITSSHVVTAAHCMYDVHNFISYKNFSVHLGIIDLLGQRNYARDQERGLATYWAYREFDITTLNKDIALLVLDQPVFFTRFVQPACVLRTADFGNKVGTVIGFGQTEYASASRTLKEANMRIVPYEHCVDALEHDNRILTDGTFCAGTPNGPSSCHGDSGSGFFIQKGGVWYLTGVVSSGLKDRFGWCVPYSTFAIVPYHLDLIDRASNNLNG